MTNFKMAAGLIASLALGVCGVARAAVVSYGDGRASLDTTTGLLWLDITQSINRSYLDVSANFGPGGDFDGYRYATSYEVLGLWQNAGIIGTGILQDCFGVDCIYAETVTADPVADFVALIGGDTFTPDYSFGGVIGLTSTISQACINCGYTAYMTPELRIYTDTNNIPTAGLADALIVEGLRDHLADPVSGSWLVSTTPVPLPAAAYLFGSGLLGIIGFSRRKKMAMPIKL